jgi:hypothetical protein
MKRVEKNLHTADKVVRLVISAVIITLFATDLIGGPLAAGLLSLAAILVITALVGFCPVYKVLGRGKNRTDSETHSM